MLSHENPIHIFSVFSRFSQQRWHGTIHTCLRLTFALPYHTMPHIFIDNLFDVTRSPSTANAIIHRCRVMHLNPYKSVFSSTVQTQVECMEVCCVRWDLCWISGGYSMVFIWVRCDETNKVTNVRPVDTRHLHTGLWRDSGGGQNLNESNLRVFFSAVLPIVFTYADLSGANIRIPYGISSVFVTVFSIIMLKKTGNTAFEHPIHTTTIKPPVSSHLYLTRSS